MFLNSFKKIHSRLNSNEFVISQKRERRESEGDKKNNSNIFLKSETKRTDYTFKGNTRQFNKPKEVEIDEKKESTFEMKTNFIHDVIYKEKLFFKNNKSKKSGLSLDLDFLLICEIFLLNSFQVIFKFILIDYKLKLKRIVFFFDSFIQEHVFRNQNVEIKKCVALLEGLSIDLIISKFVDFLNFSYISLRYAVLWC